MANGTSAVKPKSAGKLPKDKWAVVLREKICVPLDANKEQLQAAICQFASEMGYKPTLRDMRQMVKDAWGAPKQKSSEKTTTNKKKKEEGVPQPMWGKGFRAA